MNRKWKKRRHRSPTRKDVTLDIWESPTGVRVTSYDVECVRAFCRGMASVRVECQDDKFASALTSVFALLQRDEEGNRETIRKAIGRGREEMLRAGEAPVMVELLDAPTEPSSESTTGARKTERSDE